MIFPRYHQRDLINKFREHIRKDGVGTNYLVMHTTGSGKSYSIGWLAHMLVSLYKSKNDSTRMFDSIVVVTDRTVLDEQLQATIRSLSRTDGVVVGVERGSQQLREALEMGKDIVITTIQKFPFISRTIANLGKKNFAVIIDEVHSSQSGELSQELRRALTNTEDSDKDDLDEDAFDYEEMIRKEIENRRGKQENISFFGFTGTPKQKTLEVFGHKTSSGEFKPFHTYGMNQSISEGFTLDVLRNYTIYKRWFKVKETGDGKKEVSKKQGVSELIQYVDAHQITIERKVQIMLDHWFERGSKEIQGKARAMVITKSRKHCILYFRAINNRLKELGLSYRALVGFSGQITVDKQAYTESSCNKEVEHEGNVPLGLKNPKYRILVVANKFQTGFDEPLLQTMYVDKNLAGVQCVQTLSRLNRTMKAKTQTFVLDFVNDNEQIQDAFQKFYTSTLLTEETDPNILYALLRDIQDYHLYTNEDIESFSKTFYDTDRNEGHLHVLLFWIRQLIIL